MFGGSSLCVAVTVTVAVMRGRSDTTMCVHVPRTSMPSVQQPLLACL